MANRPIFFVSDRPPFFKEFFVDFTYYPGFSTVQKQKCIDSLHNAFKQQYGDTSILEVSRKSSLELGIKLSAFNLKYSFADVTTTVESAFQGSKVFVDGGPYSDLILKPSAVAKKDPRIRSGSNLIEFRLNGCSFPIIPQTFFYDWLYCNAVVQNASLLESALQYMAFTDIEFNPQKSINCQARSMAILVSLARSNLLSIVSSPDSFLEAVYCDIIVNK